MLAEMMGLPTPKELYIGKFDLQKLKEIVNSLDKDLEEGFVVRVTGAIPYDNFTKCVAKFVRANHVQTDQHWLKNAKQNGKLQ